VWSQIGPNGFWIGPKGFWLVPKSGPSRTRGVVGNRSFECGGSRENDRRGHLRLEIRRRPVPPPTPPSPPIPATRLPRTAASSVTMRVGLPARDGVDDPIVAVPGEVAGAPSAYSRR
jgi:hypothetical protein